jgi:hypothetical protein
MVKFLSLVWAWALTRRPMETVLEGSTRSWVNQSQKLERPLSNGTDHDGEGRSLKRGPFYICGRGREDELLWVLHFSAMVVSL